MSFRLPLSLLAAALAGCADKTDDTATTDDSGDPGETGADTDTGEALDSAPDTDTDTDTGGETGEDTGEDPLHPMDHYDWSRCAGAEGWVGDEAWTGVMEVKNSALYCGDWDEERTLEEELALKALLRITPGTWPVPVSDGDYALALPACTLLDVDEPGPDVSAAGTTSVTVNTWSSTSYTSLVGEQPLDRDGAAWTLGHTLLLVGEADAPPSPLVVDGSLVDSSTGAGLAFTLSEGDSTILGPEAITFGACSDESWTEDVHHVSFDGGELTLTLQLGDNISRTAAGAFVSASGTFDGESFEQTEYFRLIYRPDHHHFGRHFAVIFDAPIGDVCALRIEDFDPNAETPTATVSTADCDLTVTGTRTVTAQSVESGG